MDRHAGPGGASSGTAPEPLHVATFGSAGFDYGIRRLTRSCKRFNLPLHVYRPENSPVDKLRDSLPGHFAHPRGFGYWVWKPFIIRDALAALPDGAWLFYVDATVDFVRRPPPALLKGSPVKLFRLGQGYRIADWTKPSCLAHYQERAPFDVADEMVVGTFSLFRKSPEAEEFLDAWVEGVETLWLVDDSLTAADELARGNFREHRHDQSILSILAAQRSLPVFPDPSQHGRNHAGVAIEGIESPRYRAELAYPQFLNHHYLRDGAPRGPLDKRLRAWALTWSSALHGRRI